ncbi:MAG: type pilus assembly protein PilO [Thermosediminibacterales bacterium]|nr:type pilus assembly protein PilO [Thermosediminibacterales bacterium]
MSKLREREKKFIIVGVFIVLISLFYSFYMHPLLIKMNTLQKDLDKKQALISNIDAEINQIKQMEEKNKENLKKLETVISNIPEGINIPELLVDFEKSINENNLKQHMFTPQKLADGGEYYTLPIRVKVSGDFNNIINFLRYWENYKRLINFTEIKLYSDENLVLYGEFLANIYILKNESGFNEKLDYSFVSEEKGRNNPFYPIK